MWPDNRIARDAHYLYRYDRHGRLTEKTDLIPEGVIRTDDEAYRKAGYSKKFREEHEEEILLHQPSREVFFVSEGHRKPETYCANLCD